LKIDKTIAALSKRVENLLSGSSPVSKWDNGPSIGGPSNWDMINAVIKENEGNDWYIPKDNVINCWTCPVIDGLGNIELRDFELERKFADMRHERVEEYDRKWDEALQRNDKEYLDKHPSSAFISDVLDKLDGGRNRIL
jgi:hypothetical protein